MDKRLFLLDALALAYRAHFVFISRPLINSRGENTSATFGFANTLVKLIHDHDIDHIAVVFDVMGEGGTFRDEIYKDYKAHREPPPEALLANLPLIKEMVRAMDIPVVEMPGVEADDVIGTLARQAAAEGAGVVIVSADKDFQQLLDEHISMYRPAHRGESFDPITAASFRKKHGLAPKQFIDMLALMGDASDNVPGVPGIGEKTAVTLLQTYGSVETLLEHAAEVKGKRAREGLLAHRDDALLSKRLVTIRTDLELDLDWHELHRAAPDYERLAALFAKLEFRTLLRKAQQGTLFVEGEAPDTPAPPAGASPDVTYAALDPDAVAYRIVRTRAALEALAKHLGAVDAFAFDTETTSADGMMASLVGLSFSWAEGQGYYVPSPLPDGTSEKVVLDVLRPVLARPVLKLGQNLKYYIVVLARHGVQVEGPLFDTMIAHYLLDPEGDHTLDAIARNLLHYRKVPLSDLIGSGRTQRSMRDVPIDEAGSYACEDADIAWRLVPVLRRRLADHRLAAIATDVEFPLLYVLADMELAGFCVDPDILTDIGALLDQEIEALEAEIYEAAGTEFNVGSTQQLAEVLFDRLGLRVVGRTSKGRPSTREDVLQRLATEHPLPGLMLDWRTLAKLRSNYIESLVGLIHPETGRIHTDFNQAVAATGRLASSSPNLQNIPVRSDRGREIRTAFVAAPGHQLISADYVQIELRILASMSGDEALCQAFREGQDIHAATAARLFGQPLAAVTSAQRRKAKEVNYGIPYGVSAFGLAQRLRIPTDEAQAIITQYQQAYPGVSRFLAELVERARERGYAETLLGRRRYVPRINARNRMERSAAERIAVNAPIQGSQADMIKIAMVRIHDRLRRERLAARMLLQVHDELVFEVPNGECDGVRLLVRQEMEGALPLAVPVVVDIGAGTHWLEAH